MGDLQYDVIVVGSGFGGSVAALRLSQKGYRVAVLETGQRHRPQDFPRTNWDARRALWYPRVGMRGAFRMTSLRHALVFSGVGVGGGSLIYGGVLQQPPASVFDEGSWAGAASWARELEPHYAEARRMLGATVVGEHTAADDVLRAVAERLGAPETHHPTTVGITFANGNGSTAPSADGRTRSACMLCGGCLTGCRFGAKNTLDITYLAAAERLGARVHPRRRVTDIMPSGDGYEVLAVDPLSRRRGSRVSRYRAGQVVLAGGVLGTVKLLLTMQRTGAFPSLSAAVGQTVRTNGECIVAATARSRSVDYSQGPAISSAFHPDAHTQVQVVRFPRGSNALAGLATIVTNPGRLPRFLRYVITAVRHPATFARSLWNWHWSERTVLFLVMRRGPGSFRLRPTRRGVRSHPEGVSAGSADELATEVARAAAAHVSGDPAILLTEAILGRPATGHILGGATISSHPADGVIDAYHRLHGYPRISIVDASAIGANLGVNPALTITALAERAMSAWPAKGEPDTRPQPGSGIPRMKAADRIRT